MLDYSEAIELRPRTQTLIPAARLCTLIYIWEKKRRPTRPRRRRRTSRLGEMRKSLDRRTSNNTGLAPTSVP